MSEKKDQKRYLVIGLGISGLSCCRYLADKGLTKVADTRHNPPGLTQLQKIEGDFSLHLGDLENKLLEEIDEIVVSPGIDTTQAFFNQAREKQIPIIGDIELFARVVNKPIIAVTGSNGKSTVVSMLGAMLREIGYKAAVVGNIGEPVLDTLAKNVEVYVMELSSFQLETTYSLQPEIACILNITADHLDRYSSMQQYCAAKQRIYLHAKQVLYNREDEATIPEPQYNISKQQSFTFGLDIPNSLFEFGLVENCQEISQHTKKNTGATSQKTWLCQGKRFIIASHELALLGKHQVSNFLAAVAMCKLFKPELDWPLQTLRTFQGLAHRCQLVSQAAGITWINDSKATNVGATLAAIAGLSKIISGKWVIILGGDSKGADLRPLVGPVSEYAKAAILIGSSKQRLWQLLNKHLPCHFAENMQQMVELANTLAISGDGVLLSPACSSLDMYKNYSQRGELFEQAVQIICHAKQPSEQAAE